MNVSRFIENATVVHAIDDLTENWNGKIVSDIIDDAGHQYIDYMMEGGGTLGIALAGYTYALESVGIRFLGIGGTSAGSINAILQASAAVPSEPKSIAVLEAMAGLEMFKLVDGDSDARDFVKNLVKGAGPVKMTWKAMQVLDNLREDMGLNPGDEFTNWMQETLEGFGIQTQEDLDVRMQTLPAGLRTRSGVKLTSETAGSRLAVIASEISTETKVVFPEMAELFYSDTASVNPAQFARSSMSIPLFFHPHKIKRLPKGVPAVRAWKKLAGYEGALPSSAIFVDGGIMSNFPIDQFHEAGVPIAPTFGVKLGTERDKPHKITGMTSLLAAMFNSARHCADYDFVLRNPDYWDLICIIDTGKYNWLNFFMDDKEKVELFTLGVKAASRFLKEFDWERHKENRA